jgi:methionyl-tRNA formyltransferase
MTSFMVVGEGQPALAVLRALSCQPAAKVVALFTASVISSRLVNFAESQSIPVRPLDVLADPAAAFLGISVNIDWLLSANNTTVLPAWLLAKCRCGALNLHPGLLPEYAGLHTHQWAIRNGEMEFGSTIHFMEAKVDTGAIVRQRRFPLLSSDTGITVFKRCLKTGVKLFEEVISDILNQRPLVCIPQDLTRRVLYRHRDILDSRIDWNWTPSAIDAFVRAGNYEPFRSPTYVPSLDPTMGIAIQVLQVEIGGPTEKIPGSVLEINDKGLLVASGGGGSIRITLARNNTVVLDAKMWSRYVAQLSNNTLCGRPEPGGWALSMFQPTRRLSHGLGGTGSH